MGQCADKEVDPGSSSPEQSRQVVGRGGSPYDVRKQQSVAIKAARGRSSNPTLTAARYHLDSERRLQRDYELTLKVLGQGLCGDVCLVRGIADGRSYALKTISKRQVSPTKVRQLCLEVEIYLTLDHPNIARLHDVYESEQQISLITECCHGGELYLRLQQRGVYTDADAAEASRQMLRAVGYLHAHNVVHRDLKLENFLYESEAADAQLKLIDFGFAKLWDPSTLMMASCGSIAYVSPDVLSGRGYTNKCDLWSLGVIVWMLLAGYPPFHGEEQAMMQKIKAGLADWSHRKRWEPVSAEAVGFVKKLLTMDPVRRPDAREALQHVWLTTVHAGGQGAGAGALSREVLRSLQSYAKSSKARRAVLRLLAQELGPEETHELRDIFLAIDRSNRGTICLSDLKDAIRGMDARTPTRRRAEGRPSPTARYGGGSAADEISPLSGGSPTTPARRLMRSSSGALEELFDVLSENAEERIYYMDFLAATMEVRSRLREEALRATFARLDADESGTISADDLRNVLGDSFEDVDAEDIIAEADPDGTGEISFDAFVRVLEEMDATPSPRAAVSFRRYAIESLDIEGAGGGMSPSAYAARRGA